MKIFYSELFSIPLPEHHTFPMPKYRLLRQRILDSGIAGGKDFHIPSPATFQEITRVHAPEYLRRIESGELTEKEIRRIGLPWSPELVERAKRSSGATIAACRAALVDGVAVNLGGGTHHAFPDRGQGYCLLNDAAIAVRAMQAENRVQRALIVDCDVHQGDGTAAIFINDPTVFTFSIHGASNFPLQKQQSDLDIALADGAEDAEYLDALEPALVLAFDRARAGLAIYLSGADAFAGDRFGKLKLSKAGLLERDRMVFRHCRKAGLPVAVAMAGGYAHNIQDVVDIHFNTVAAACDHFQLLGPAAEHEGGGDRRTARLRIS